MQFSYQWLRQYLPELSDVSGDGPDKVAKALTRSGLNVDYAEPHPRDSGPDVVFEVEVTTNRPDAMNHLGVTRELAVALDLRLEEPDFGTPGDDSPLPATVRVEAPGHCPRFTARVIEGVKVGPSPAWLVEHLEAIGSRSINNIVDITNYLLWETGQPQHAYDLDTLRGGGLIVRHAREGETLETLDGVSRELDSSMLLICDHERPVGLAGIMGGLDTEVTEKTTRILLECAWFDPLSVRLTARRLGMHTDASHRFERGADFEMALRANDRACAMIAEVAGGTVLPGVIDERSEDHLPKRHVIRLDPEKAAAFAGAAIDAADQRRWLEGLGFELTEAGEGTSETGPWQVRAPSWRALDMERTADVYEEVIRLYGFDEVPACLPDLGGSDGPESLNQKRRRLIREHFFACGFAEAINWSFHDQARDQQFAPVTRGAGPIVLQNALSERYEVLRRSMIPGLLESARFNLRRGAEQVRLFEIGHVFATSSSKESAGPADAAEEFEAFAVIGGGRLQDPWQSRRELDLLDIKGMLDTLAEGLGTALEVRPAEVAGLVKGVAAELLVSGQKVGHLGQLDLAGEDTVALFAAELRSDALGDESMLRLGAPIVPPSRFPGVSADTTLTHSLEVSWQQMSQAVFEAETLVPDLLSFRLKDQYRGKGVPEGCVNSTLAFMYGSSERSLTQDEVNSQHEALAQHLRDQFS